MKQSDPQPICTVCLSKQVQIDRFEHLPQKLHCCNAPVHGTTRSGLRLREELRPERSLDPKVLCALEFSCVCVLCVCVCEWDLGEERKVDG